MTPTKFQHAGLDWHPHTPGDPMPCPPDTLVRVLLRNLKQGKAEAWVGNWAQIPGAYGLEIIGWHPVEEQPDPAITGRCRGRCPYHSHEHSVGWPIAEKCKAWDEDKDGPEPYYLRGAAQCKPATRLGRKPGY